MCVSQAEGVFQNVKIYSSVLRWELQHLLLVHPASDRPIGFSSLMSIPIFLNYYFYIWKGFVIVLFLFITLNIQPNLINYYIYSL